MNLFSVFGNTILNKPKEDTTVTPKELLYIEDALGHEKQVKETCQSSINLLEDAELKSFVSQLCTKHQTCFENFYRLLG